MVWWFKSRKNSSHSATQHAVAAKARGLFNEIQQKDGGNDTFAASKGWFVRFKQRLQIRCIKISEEPARANTEATRTFTAEFKNIIDDIDFQTDLVFNVGETGLCWGKITVKSLHLDRRKIGYVVSLWYFVIAAKNLLSTGLH